MRHCRTSVKCSLDGTMCSVRTTTRPYFDGTFCVASCQTNIQWLDTTAHLASRCLQLVTTPKFQCLGSSSPTVSVAVGIGEQINTVQTANNRRLFGCHHFTHKWVPIHDRFCVRREFCWLFAAADCIFRRIFVLKLINWLFTTITRRIWRRIADTKFIS